MNKPISSYMTKAVHTIGADQTLEHAKKMMYTYGIRHLPVLDSGKLVGILSDRDIKLAYAIDGASAAKSTTGDSCTSESYSVPGTQDLKSVATTMAARTIGCCVITDNDAVIGIFTATDACRILGEVL